MEEEEVVVVTVGAVVEMEVETGEVVVAAVTVEVVVEMAEGIEVAVEVMGVETGEVVVVVAAEETAEEIGEGGVVETVEGTGAAVEEMEAETEVEAVMEGATTAVDPAMGVGTEAVEGMAAGIVVGEVEAAGTEEVGEAAEAIEVVVAVEETEEEEVVVVVIAEVVVEEGTGAAVEEEATEEEAEAEEEAVDVAEEDEEVVVAVGDAAGMVSLSPYRPSSGFPSRSYCRPTDVTVIERRTLAQVDAITSTVYDTHTVTRTSTITAHPSTTVETRAYFPPYFLLSLAGIWTDGHWLTGTVSSNSTGFAQVEQTITAPPQTVCDVDQPATLTYVSVLPQETTTKVAYVTTSTVVTVWIGQTQFSTHTDYNAATACWQGGGWYGA
ncbi:hypothetical protein VTK73DRAFT_2596 [Phialemonium thermophilum]|uniref:Uncharacterized protein n=1 Tax=Phialemonium thermophilum TaxID=223376 RepID=A0ABR3VQY0_9PEZI